MNGWMNHYPRPQLRRESFFSLDGEWRLGGEAIEAPFPPESRLSGYRGAVGDTLYYERRFELPAGFAMEGQRVRLHFGAVDQIAEVFLNGQPVVRHEGGYLPFFADVTATLRPGENTLNVIATDMLDKRFPYGKQTRVPGGMWYTPVSGIWQTVWLEALPSACIEGVRFTPDLNGVSVSVDCPQDACTVTIEGEAPRLIPTREAVYIPISSPRLWSPESPTLYHATIRTDTDIVTSYFALRTIDVREIGGVKRICLNGKPIFLAGVLDQGYFEDGLFLPATPEGYEADIRRMKAMGFNLLRKHIKVEPEAFYYACDRLGMLVLQDMVNSGPARFLLDTALPTLGLKRCPDHVVGAQFRKDFFRQHCLDTVARVYNHPCVIGYTIFNEGWGQFDADEMYQVLKRADASRLIDATSGWFAQHLSDVDSPHVYFRNKRLKPRAARPMLLSECGGYKRRIEGHLYKPDARYGYGSADSEQALTDKLTQLAEVMVLPAIPKGLCGMIYTQLSDVEEEINGLYTYDRQVCKVDEARIAALTARLKKALADCCSEPLPAEA